MFYTDSPAVIVNGVVCPIAGNICMDQCMIDVSAVPDVKVGDEVNAGTVIGSVGDTADIEANMEPHLHFAIKRAGNWIDPIDYISPSK